MERTFKHKKTGEVAYYKDGVCRQGRFCVEIGVEPSSEYWEEVIENPPLTKTFDGVDVFEGDNVAWVIRGEFSYMLTLHKIHIKSCLQNSEIYKIFSSKKKALEWVEENRPKVLFTTRDNVDLKFGDKFYVVDTQYFKIFEAEAGITFKSEKWIKNSYADKKLAEEWIVMNKPVLSLNNLLSVWGAMENKDFYAISPLFKNFKEIAENKIKNQ
jgi:hypothetical protein